jgi:hypothetical protein
MRPAPPKPRTVGEIVRMIIVRTIIGFGILYYLAAQ